MKLTKILNDLKPVRNSTKRRAFAGPLKIEEDISRPVAIEDMYQYYFTLELGRRAYCKINDVEHMKQLIKEEIVHYLYGDLEAHVRELEIMWHQQEDRYKIKDKFAEIQSMLRYKP